MLLSEIEKAVKPLSKEEKEQRGTHVEGNVSAWYCDFYGFTRDIH